VRINAGVSEPFTDSNGQVWQPDSGFEGGMMSQMSGGSRRYGGPGGPGGPGRSRGPRAAYASPIAIDFEGQRQYVQLISNALVAFAASDGKFLWRYDKPANTAPRRCTMPAWCLRPPPMVQVADW
jgi:alcohol dehydrogenase (cytochrome c)